MKLAYKITFYIIAFALSSFSQGQYNNWYFGTKAAINITSTSVTAITSSTLYCGDASASISDNAGNLLFYTNGVDVYDKNNNLMPNGIKLGADYDNQQGVLIVPKPGNPNLYYLFTVGDTASPFNAGLKLYYSVIDMTLNSSSGDVAIKPIQLDVKTSEKLTAAKHSNGQDFWIVSYDYTNTKYKSYLLTSAGLNTVAVVSSVGLNQPDWTGAIRISNNGCWMVALSRKIGASTIELFHFNNSTGTVSGNSFITTNSPYGIEFSPGSTKFYVGHNSNMPIDQFNLLAVSDSLILASKTAVSSLYPARSLQLAPNGKIYIDDAIFSNSLGAINNPDNLGVACGFASNQVPYIGGGGSLPNNFNLLYTGTASCGPLNIENGYSQSVVSVYPNPTSEILLIDSYLEINEIRIFDFSGKEVLIEKGNAISGVSVSELCSGIYVVEIKGRDLKLNKKISVQH